MGVEIPQYSCVRRLDRDGLAPVWLAEQVELERFAAIRLLSTDGERVDDRLIRAFEREGRLLARIRHENVVNVYEIGTAGPIRFRTMEYLDGGSLADRMLGAGVSPQQAIDLCFQIGRALAAAHQEGICPQDLSPRSIMMRGDATPVLTDLAMLRLEVDADPDRSTGVEHDSIRYLSPEQLQGRAADVRSNVFMLGLLLFDLIGREPPADRCRADVPGKDEIAARSQALPTDLQPVESILHRMLAARPEDRYAELGEVLAALSHLKPMVVVATNQPEVSPERPTPRRKRMRLLAPGTALVILGAAFAAWQLVPSRLGEEELASLQNELLDFGTYMSRMDIYGPPGANATAALERMMAISRKHPSVLEAADILAAIYLQDAHDSFSRDDLEDARRLVDKGLEFKPGDELLTQLKGEVSRKMQEERVDRLLQAAESAMQSKNFFPPADGNAYSLLMQVEKLDPANRDADTALREIQLYIAEQARMVWGTRGWREARGLAVEGLDLFPDSLLLQDLLADLEHAEPQTDPTSAERTP